MRKYILKHIVKFHGQILSVYYSLSTSETFYTIILYRHQTTAETSCSIWITHSWHPIFTSGKQSSYYDCLSLTYPLNTAQGHVIKVGERYVPYNPNIIMLTFFFKSVTLSQMAASQITTPLLLFIAASQRLKDKNSSSKIHIKNILLINTPALLYKVLFTAIRTNAMYTLSRCTLQISFLQAAQSCSRFNSKLDCSPYFLETFCSIPLTHSYTHRIFLNKTVTISLQLLPQ